MIHIEELSFMYDKQSVLRSLSLDIKKGEIVAIVGQSGCGKSTLLNLIAGVLRPNNGCIAIETKDISYLMQDVTLLPYMTVRENVLLGYTLRNKNVDEKAISDADNMLQLFQIERDDYEKFPHQLSGGMKQKVALVQTLLTSPELLLLDEPFTGIDIHAQSDIENRVYSFVKKRGITMVLITHNIEQAIVLCDRIVIIKGKSIFGDVSLPDDFIKESPFKRRSMEKEGKELLYDVIQKM